MGGSWEVDRLLMMGECWLPAKRQPIIANDGEHEVLWGGNWLREEGGPLAQSAEFLCRLAGGWLDAT